MPNDSSDPCKCPAFDSDQRYRDRLAEVVRAILDAADPERASLRQELQQLIFSPIYSENNPAVPHAEMPLMEKLKLHPDLQSRLSLLTQYSTSKWLLEQELIARGKMSVANPGDAYEVAKTVKATGVCFSGGGIRSATFNLGVLQGLAKLHKLELIDYLSTVSGGGYIHQFLAAWIKSEEEVAESGLASVEEKLIPIPARGSTHVIAPEPIRWLRRYSNYLAPSVSVFGADVWTMIEVWIRNTALNLVILTTAITTALLLPHLALTDWALHRHMPQSFAMRLTIYAALMLLAGFAVCLLGYSFPRYNAKAEQEGQLGDSKNYPKSRTRIWHPYAIAIVWLIVSAFSSSVVYRLSIPGGSPYSATAQRDYARDPSAVSPGQHQVSIKTAGVAYSASLAENGKPALQGKRRHTRIGLAWKDKPSPALPQAFLARDHGCLDARIVYAVHELTPANDASRMCAADPHLTDAKLAPLLAGLSDRCSETPLLWLYESLPFLCALFCGALWFGRKETRGAWASLLSFVFCPLLAFAFSVALIFLLEHLFFALSFAVAPDHVMALGIACLPSFLLAVPFITLELYTGLMGTLYASAQREWVARLRAVSFQISCLWLALCGTALIGPYIVAWIGDEVVLKYAVWSTWLISSVSGVILAKNRSTSGKPKDPDDPGAGSGLSAQELIVKIAPPLFMVGLFFLLADLAGWLLAGEHVSEPNENFLRWCVLALVLVVTCMLFAWRVDINEFSMNSFYRDRLARCYAGASNRERKPNRFTGFDFRDNSWRVTGLLPRSWTDLCGSQGTYDGPFPIFCTALNITTGRELAYQERKAASFAITPLYTGYSTGWTDATG
jgi:hypothetical protein